MAEDAVGEEEDEEAFQRLYGSWQPLEPRAVAELFEGCGFPWWIAGGRALEAVGAESRPHGDTDVVVLRRDLTKLRELLADYHLWEAHSGTLRPLLAGEQLTRRREQLWMRKDAFGPWVLDILLSPSVGDTWIYKRQRDIRLPMHSVGHEVSGVVYLRPEIVLLFKAKHRRPKDERDFASVATMLDAESREFLLQSLRSSEPASPWIAKLEALG